MLDWTTDRNGASHTANVLSDAGFIRLSKPDPKAGTNEAAPEGTLCSFLSSAVRCCSTTIGHAICGNHRQPPTAQLSAWSGAARLGGCERGGGIAERGHPGRPAGVSGAEGAGCAAAVRGGRGARADRAHGLPRRLPAAAARPGVRLTSHAYGCSSFESRFKGWLVFLC